MRIVPPGLEWDDFMITMNRNAPIMETKNYFNQMYNQVGKFWIIETDWIIGLRINAFNQI